MYTLAWRSHREGIPVVRPVFWSHPDLCNLWDVDDQFLLGDDILVAPVLTHGCTTREVVLPPGDWYYFWNDTCYSGHRTIKIPVTLEHIPIFIRAGSILPREISKDELDLHIYPTIDHRAFGMHYSDAGDGFDNWRVEEYRLDQSNGNIVINRLVAGDFPFPYQTLQILVHGEAESIMWDDDQAVAIRYASGSTL